MTTNRSITRRLFLRSAASAAGLGMAGLFSGFNTVTGAKRPNVLIVFVDQWRSSAFGHGSDKEVKTPNLDALAKDGALLKRAYAADPLCTPNRSSLMTGRFPHQTGMITNNLMLPPTEECFAEVFRDAGYDTMYIGKWHIDGPAKPGFVPPGWRRRGFEKFVGFNRGHAYYRSKTFSNEGKFIPMKGFEPSRQADLAIDFIKKKRSKPFLCFLSWGPPHTPYNPPKKYRRFFQMGDKLPFRDNIPEKMKKSKRVRKFISGYFGLCETLDFEAGRVLNALKKQGLEKNTIILFTSDHGDMLGSRGLFFKNQPFEESLHIPMMVKAPGLIPQGREVDEPVSTVDIGPTLISLCGLKGLSKAEGVDISPLLTGKGAIKREAVYAEGRVASLKPPKGNGKGKGKQKRKGGGQWRAVVTNNHKLILNANGKPSHIFDLGKDPLEKENLLGTEDGGSLLEKLAKLGKAWAEKTSDPYPKGSKPAAAGYKKAKKG